VNLPHRQVITYKRITFDKTHSEFGCPATFSMYGFTSTSLNQESATKFLGEKTEHMRPVLFKIKWTENFNNLRVMNSRFPSEQEVILNEGRKFSIAKCTVENGIDIIHLECFDKFKFVEEIFKAEDFS
jgi:hypothetical protein